MKTYRVRLGNGKEILKTVIIEAESLQEAATKASSETGLVWFDVFETSETSKK